MPYWVWRALPSCSRQVPARATSHWASSSKGARTCRWACRKRRYLGLDLVWLNCAFCHTGSCATRAERARIVPPCPPTLRLPAVHRTSCSTRGGSAVHSHRISSKSTGWAGTSTSSTGWSCATTVCSHAGAHLSLRARLQPLRQLQPEPWGPGRVDTFQPAQVYFGFPLDKLPERELVAPPTSRRSGTREAPAHAPAWTATTPRWRSEPQRGARRRRDAATLDRANMKRVEDWILTLAPPPYLTDRPGPGCEGRAIYKTYCATVTRRRPELRGEVDRAGHAHREDRTDRIASTPTPPRRPEPEPALRGYERFTHSARRTVTRTCARRLWLRAPYSTTLGAARDLLERQPAPATFHRGYDSTTRQGGLRVDGPAENGRAFFLFDTSQRGNGNAATRARLRHELSSAEKDALIEY